MFFLNNKTALIKACCIILVDLLCVGVLRHRIRASLEKLQLPSEAAYTKQ